MMIERDGLFLVDRQAEPDSSIGIESHILDQCIEEAVKRNVRSVFGSADVTRE